MNVNDYIKTETTYEEVVMNVELASIDEIIFKPKVCEQIEIKKDSHITIKTPIDNHIRITAGGLINNNTSLECSNLVIKKTKQTFLKDKFIDDFSMLIAEMCKHKALRNELEEIIRFTEMVLNDPLTLREAVIKRPTIIAIFDKYYNKDSADTYFNCITAFKYLMEGKKVRRRDWLGGAYIYYDKSARAIRDELYMSCGFNVINTSDDAVWELFKED